MKTIRKNLKWITVIIVMIIIACFIGIKYSISSNNTEQVVTEEFDLDNQTEEEKKEENIEPIQNVFVDVKGAVISPGVYEIENNKKVIDVVQLAGGFADNANTSMVNLAKKVTNEMVVIIYTNEEVKKASESDSIAKVIDSKCVCPKITNDACLKQNSSSNSNESNNSTNNSDNTDNNIVNINTATIEELLTLNGIGESKAKAIIAYREEHGNFKKIEELLEVSGIGESLYEKIKANITV